MINIDKDVPFPERKKPTTAGNLKYPWKEMQVGDSILTDIKDGSSYASTVAKKLGFKMTSRKEGSGTRIWRKA